MKPECHVDHEERRPKVRINPGVWIAESCMWNIRVPDIAHRTESSVSRDAPLNLDMNESLCARIGYISQCRDENGGMVMCEIEAINQLSVDPPEWDDLDLGVPNDFLSKVHREPNRICVGRHFKHAGDAAGIESVSFFPER